MCHKERVFRFARKRGIPYNIVRDILSDLGAPPTLKEKGAQWKTVWMHRPGMLDVPLSVRQPSDMREITPQLAAQAKSILEGVAEFLKEGLTTTTD